MVVFAFEYFYGSFEYLGVQNACRRTPAAHGTKIKTWSPRAGEPNLGSQGGQKISPIVSQDWKEKRANFWNWKEKRAKFGIGKKNVQHLLDISINKVPIL